MLTQIHHITMAVPDLEAGRSFYGRTLELNEIDKGVTANGRPTSFIQIGPSMLILEEDPAAPLFDHTPGTLRPEIDHFALYADDLDTVFGTLKDRDIVFMGAPHTTELGHRNMQRKLVTCKDPIDFHVQMAEVVDPRPELIDRRAAKKAMAEAFGTNGALFGGIDHISTYCTDFSATRAFYREILGLDEFFYSNTREEGVSVATGFEQAAFAIGGTDIELASDDTWQQLGPGPVRALGFTTDDVAQAYEILQSRGANPDGPPTDLRLPFHLRRRAFTVQGPDGLSVQIVQDMSST